MWFSDHWWRTEFRWLAETIFAEHDGNTYFEITLMTSPCPFLLYLSFEFSGGGWGRVFFFLIKFELIPLCSQLLACNNSPLKHEQWEKIHYLLCHSLSHMLQDVGQASLPTWEPLGTIPATVSLHPSDTFTILPWWTLSLCFTTELLSQIFNCLRHRPHHNIYLSDLAGVQPLADYSWLPPTFCYHLKIHVSLVYKQKQKLISLSLPVCTH